MPTIAQTLLEQGRDEGERKGRREGLLDSIAFALELRFGTAGLALMPEIAAIESVANLQTIRDALRTVAGPEALRVLYHRGNRSIA